MIPLIKTARRLALNITDGGERMAWRRRGGGGGGGGGEIVLW